MRRQEQRPFMSQQEEDRDMLIGQRGQKRAAGPHTTLGRATVSEGVVLWGLSLCSGGDQIGGEPLVAQLYALVGQRLSSEVASLMPRQSHRN